MTTIELFKTCEIRPQWITYVNKQANKILLNIDRYNVVSKNTSVPSWLIGALHLREASMNFQTHLANGDALFDNNGTPIKTVHVPKDFGPFNTWEEGAVAALKKRNLHLIPKWDIGVCLDEAEKYNGLGYRKKKLRSPYVWGLTNLQQPGKYVADGKFDRTVMDQQIGVAAIAIAIASKGHKI